MSAPEKPSALERSQDHFAIILKTTLLSSCYVSIDIFAIGTKNESFVELRNIPIDKKTLDYTSSVSCIIHAEHLVQER